MTARPEPLRWPSHFPPTDRWKRFFIGVRWLGPDLSFFSVLREQQGRRTDACMSAWADGEQCRLAREMGRILQVQLGWSTPYFVPDDSFHVTAYGPRSQEFDDLGSATALNGIEEEARREFPPGFWERAAEQGWSFGVVVAAVLALPPREIRAPRRWWRFGR